jgi:hypothetical protein
MITLNKITEIFCIADDFYKEFNEEIKKHQLPAFCDLKKPDDSSRMPDSEMIPIFPTLTFFFVGA